MNSPRTSQRIDSLVSTKDPQLVQIGHTPGKSGRRLVERM
jgi:hypothetical protein